MWKAFLKGVDAFDVVGLGTFVFLLITLSFGINQFEGAGEWAAWILAGLILKKTAPDLSK
jgi:hypothetical protein